MASVLKLTTAVIAIIIAYTRTVECSADLDTDSIIIQNAGTLNQWWYALKVRNIAAGYTVHSVSVSPSAEMATIWSHCDLDMSAGYAVYQCEPAANSFVLPMSVRVTSQVGNSAVTCIGDEVVTSFEDSMEFDMECNFGPIDSPTPSPTGDVTLSPTTVAPTTVNPTFETTTTMTTTSESTSTSVSPTAQPSPEASTGIPTAERSTSVSPTELPTIDPTLPEPITTSPTILPTTESTTSTTTVLSDFPTNDPTGVPTDQTTTQSIITMSPSTFPSEDPTSIPTSNPTDIPSTSSTDFPTNDPTKIPTTITVSPSTFPSKNPTSIPTDIPTTVSPTLDPTNIPTTPSPTHVTETITIQNVGSIGFWWYSGIVERVNDKYYIELFSVRGVGGEWIPCVEYNIDGQLVYECATQIMFHFPLSVRIIGSNHQEIESADVILDMEDGSVFDLGINLDDRMVQ